MNILFIASRFPYPPLQGDSLRAYHQIRMLSRRHRITLLAPAPADQGSLGHVARFCERIVTIPASPLRRAVHAAASFINKLPLQTNYWFERRHAEAARKLIDSTPFDLAHVQLVRMAPIAQALNRLPRVIDLIDALSLNFARRATRGASILHPLWRLEATRLAAYERRLLDIYDRAIVVAAADRIAIGARDNLHVVPNGVDARAIAFRRDGRDRSLIVMSGRMGYAPNAEGAAWFAREVMPLIAREAPHARFMIVGADPPTSMGRLAVNGVQVTGAVPSVMPYLHRAAVAVAPLLSGAGMQNKVLEAMAAGAPVVATPIAAAGLGLAVASEHLLIARDAKEFACHALNLLGDQKRAAMLATNARRLVEEHYSWERSARELERIYQLAIETPRTERRVAAAGF
jgi:sugar transferase (PEP-CTERM/EpsH1 system associated)